MDHLLVDGPRTVLAASSWMDWSCFKIYSGAEAQTYAPYSSFDISIPLENILICFMVADLLNIFNEFRRVFNCFIMDTTRDMVLLNAQDVARLQVGSMFFLTSRAVHGDGVVRPFGASRTNPHDRQAPLVATLLARHSHQLGPGSPEARETAVGRLVQDSAGLPRSGLSLHNASP